MRDPSGNTWSDQNHFYRSVNESQSQIIRKLESIAGSSAVLNKALLKAHFLTNDIVSVEKIPFIVYPHEWCDSQLSDAASLTSRVSNEIARYDLELKDASAYNVIFKNCQPIFCDYGSFQVASGNHWHAFGQFLRHFYYPLWLAKFRDVPAFQWHKMSRDGVSLDLIKKIVRPSLLATPILRLLTFSKTESKQQTVINEFDSSKRRGVYKGCDWLLNTVSPKVHGTYWADYESDRAHYDDEDLSCKRDFVSKALAFTSESFVLDIGCNQGEFSLLCESMGASVVALDFDHDAIEGLYNKSKGKNVYPLIANFDDIAGPVGWIGGEIIPLGERLFKSFDLVLALAVIHHLAVTGSLPFNLIFKSLASFTKAYLVVELIPETDPMLITLCASRGRQPSEFAISSQYEALTAFFDIVKEEKLVKSDRILCLVKLKAKK